MGKLLEVKKVEYEKRWWQFADREEAQKFMKEKGYKGYKVIAEYNEFIEVIFATKLVTE